MLVGLLGHMENLNSKYAKLGEILGYKQTNKKQRNTVYHIEVTPCNRATVYIEDDHACPQEV